jgi:hypothetical protein
MFMLKICFFCDRLVAVLEKVLDATTRTKKLLRDSCEEAQHLLSNWHIPDASVHEELPQCTCDDDNDDNSKISEVVKDIEQVVEQAQKLRETLSTSKPQAKRLPLIKKCNIEKIPQLGFSSKNLNDKVQKKTQSAKLSSVNKPLTTGNGFMKRSVNNSVVKRSSLDNCSPRATQTNTKRRSIPIPILNGNCDKKAVTQPRLKSSPSLQTTYQKDFSIHANCSTTRHRAARSCSLKPKDSSVKEENTALLWLKNTNAFYVRNMERDTKKSNSTSFSEKMGISDLEDLLSRVTVYPNINPDIKKSEIPKVKLNCCLLNGDKIANIAKNDYRAVKLAEAVDVLGVPSDLVKVLKTYHSFFEERHRGKKSGSDAGKGQVAAKSFLNKLSTMVSYGK